MELIEKINMRIASSGRKFRWALFLCPYCNQKVERQYRTGLKNKSCGCAKGKLSGEHSVTHGHTRNGQEARLYRCWANMKNRCYDLDATGYKNYGGRGIKVCDEWKNDYIPFKNWALNNGYKENLTIDRRNNNGNYEPNNCRFVTHAVNNQNTRNTKLNTVKAKEIRKSFSNGETEYKILAKKFGVSHQLISNIVHNRNWVD